MTRLFASHLAQKATSTFVRGEYDPEQELWVANNQLQGVGLGPNYTDTTTNTATEIGTTRHTTVLTGIILDSDVTLDTTLVPDVDGDADV